MSQPASPPLRDILRQRFGFPGFRKGQEQICQTIADGVDTLVVMPTGAGKSLCYQLPALARGGTTLVVSPLLALMKDQVDALTAKGVRATAINSSITMEERRERMRGLANGEWELVYVAPERFTPGFLRSLRDVDIRLLAIDEAHCLSQWGHDFRPDYLRLGRVREALGCPPTAALTATATPAVQEDILRTLGVLDAKRFVLGFDRDNLALEVIDTPKEADKLALLPDLVQGGTTLIYCATRKHVEKVAAHLHGAGIHAGTYHGGMDMNARKHIQDEFMSGRVRVVVATNAFGMGVDKDDVRCIVHYEIPGTVEAYYQEIGRAGRDGRPSRVVLLFREGDRRTQEFFIQMAHPPASHVRAVYTTLLEHPTDEVWITHEELAEKVQRSRTGCDDLNERTVASCIYLLQREGWLRRLSASRRDGRATLNPRRPARRPQGVRGTLLRHIIAETERRADDDGEQTLSLEPGRVCAQLSIERDQFTAAIRGLESRGYLTWAPPGRGGGVKLMRRDEPFDLDETRLRDKRQQEYRKLERMVGYAHAGCRRRYLVEHFGQQPPWERCGTCDACREGRTLRQGPRPPGPDEELVIRKLLATVARMGRPFSPAMVARVATGSREKSVVAFGFDRLSTHGILASWTTKEVEALIDALVKAEALTMDFDTRQVNGAERTYKVVSLSELGGHVMRQTTDSFELEFPRTAHLTRPRPTTPQGASVANDLLAELRNVRTRLAKAESVPAYVVAPNRTLEELATTRPTTAWALEKVHGMGKSRMRRYAGPFLDTIRAWTGG